MSKRASSDGVWWIEGPRQLAVIASAMRQEILDSVKALGPCSIADLARELGVPADSLYYHVRMLTEVGLLVEQGSRNTARRKEKLYALPDCNMRLRYDLADPENLRRIDKIVTSMLRVAERDFQNGLRSERAVVDGPMRNVWGSRSKAWLTEEEVREVNRHLEALAALFESPRGGGDRRLYALTWVMAPIEEYPIRR